MFADFSKNYKNIHFTFYITFVILRKKNIRYLNNVNKYKDKKTIREVCISKRKKW